MSRELRGHCYERDWHGGSSAMSARIRPCASRFLGLVLRRTVMPRCWYGRARSGASGPPEMGALRAQKFPGQFCPPQRRAGDRGRGDAVIYEEGGCPVHGTRCGKSRERSFKLGNAPDRRCWSSRLAETSLFQISAQVAAESRCMGAAVGAPIMPHTAVKCPRRGAVEGCQLQAPIPQTSRYRSRANIRA
jgi:hypothetical protein